MNSDDSIAVSLALFTDFCLTKGLLYASADEIDACLNNVIAPFAHLYNRDLFLHQYKKCLALRLLNKTLLSVETEERMVEKLKVQCGVSTMNKITKMFTDL